MRAAVYATPSPGSPLAHLAARWLGRDAFTGKASRPADPVRDPLVAEPARYGFHATLRAPFRLGRETTLAALSNQLAEFCAGRSAPVIAKLALSRLEPFFALTSEEPEAELTDLEAGVLDLVEPFRAPLTETEIARRRPQELSLRQRELLMLWGYPFVRDQFRFHMTLTGPVLGQAEGLHRALVEHFDAVLGRPLVLDGLGVFVEPEAGAPFQVHSFHPFRPAAAIRASARP